jgi:MFS family permease
MHFLSGVDTSLSTIQWVTSGYLLALAVMLPLNGWLVERIGAKALYLWCFAAFMLSSTLCGLAWSANALIAFRVLQGMSGGLLAPMTQMMIARRRQTHGAHHGLCCRAHPAGADTRPRDRRRYTAVSLLALALSRQPASRRIGNRIGHMSGANPRAAMIWDADRSIVRRRVPMGLSRNALTLSRA